MSAGTVQGRATASAEISPFGDIHIADRHVSISINAEYGPDPYREAITESNGATYTQDGVENKLDTGTTANGVVETKSAQVLNYQPSSTAYGSGFFRRDPATAPDTDQAVYWGLGSEIDENGLFFKWDSTGIHLVRVKAGTEIDILADSDADSLWSNSREPSVSKLDTGRIWYIKSPYYGLGPVFMGNYDRDKIRPTFDGDREDVFVIYDPTRDSNVQSQYMNTSNLRWIVRAQNGSTAPTSTTSFYTGHRQGSLYGQQNNTWRYLWDKTGTVSIGTSRTPMMAIRPRQPFQGKANTIKAQIQKITGINNGSNEIQFEMAIFNRADVTADNFNASQHSDQTSAIEIATAAENISLTFSDAIIQGLEPELKVKAGQNKQDFTKEEGDQIQDLGQDQVAVIFGTADGSATDGKVKSKRAEGW